MNYTQILSHRYNFEPDKWRIEDKFNTFKFYYAIIHDKTNGDFVYHSIASKGKNQWQFETEAKLKISLTNGVTGSGYFTQQLIDEGIIEIKIGINNITTVTEISEVIPEPVEEVKKTRSFEFCCI